MAIVINGSGTVTGISVGGLPDDIVDSGTLASDALDSAVTINDSGADVDFRVESDTLTNALFVQGSDGHVGINQSSPYGTLSVAAAEDGNNRGLDVSSAYNAMSNYNYNSNASLTAVSNLWYTTKSGNSDFKFLAMASAGSADPEFHFDGDGDGTCDGSWTGGGADYAEYFEWSDGNASNEDRRGFSVVLDDNKIRPAVDGDSPIGVISGRPVVIGDNDIDRWKQKYLRDDFGAYIWESKTHTVWQEQVIDDEGVESEIKKEFQSDRIPANETVPDNAVVKTEDEEGRPLIRRKLNPDWVEGQEYISREDRPEWDTVGLMGKVRILKGQQVDSRWIKMRDVSDTVEEWLIR
jgi:hypothetical protein